MPRVVSPLLSAALAGLVALAVTTGESWLVASAVVLVQVLVAVPPPTQDARTWVFVPVVAGGLVATLLTHDPSLLAGTSGTRSGRDALVSSGVMAGALPGVAVVVGATLVGQMLRRDGRVHVVAAITSVTSLGVLAVLASGWVSAARTSLSTDVVLMGAIALTVALLVAAVPGDRVLVASAAVVAGIGAGALVPLLVDGAGTWLLGAAVGGGAASCALLGQVVGRAWPGVSGEPGRLPAGPAAWGFPAAVSVALVGPVVHVAAQLVVLAV